MSWLCPYQDGDSCKKLKRNCKPGIKGCVLGNHGQFIDLGEELDGTMVEKVETGFYHYQRGEDRALELVYVTSRETWVTMESLWANGRIENAPLDKKLLQSLSLASPEDVRRELGDMEKTLTKFSGLLLSEPVDPGCDFIQ